MSTLERRCDGGLDATDICPTLERPTHRSCPTRDPDRKLRVHIEGSRILDEGIALRSSDIDVVMVNGYGFPRWRGGPMFMADEMGAGETLRRIEAHASRRAELAREVNDVRAVLARLDAEVVATEAQLSAHGGDDIGDVVESIVLKHA